VKERWKSSTLSVLVGAVLAIAGCSTSPLAPNGTTGAGGSSEPPPLASIAPDGTMDFIAAPVESMPGDTLRIVGATADMALTGSAKIDGEKGGRLRVGRYLIDVPAGAWSGPAMVTLTMPDSTVMFCDLAIQPLAANHFKVPVRLTADLSAPGMTDASDCTNYWYDTSRTTWVSLASKSRCSGTQITTELEHFSQYGSGKAGW